MSGASQRAAGSRRRRIAASALAAVSVAGLGGGASSGLAAEAGLTVGPDGSVWSGATVRSPDGTYRRYRTPDALADVALGGDGTLWGLEQCGRVVRVIPSTGLVTAFPNIVKATPNGECDHGSIVAGADGNMWFTNGSIGRIALNPPAASETCTAWTRTGPADAPTTVSCGAYTAFRTPFPTSDLAVGTDGNLWFTTTGAPQLGRFDVTSHTVRMLPIPAVYGSSAQVTVTPDGSAWFTTSTEPARLGRMTQDGTVHPVALRGVAPEWDLTAAADGSVWFTCTTRTRTALCRIDPVTGALRVVARPDPEALPGGIAAAPDGSIWFTQGSRALLGRLLPDGRMLDHPPNPRITRAARRGTTTLVFRLSCPAAQGERCTGRLRVYGPGAANLAGAAGFRIGPGRTSPVAVRLSPAARRFLRAKGRLRITATTMAETLSGTNARTFTVTRSGVRG